MNFDKFVDLFSRSQLYFRSASLFDDTFEGSFPDAESSITQLAKWDDVKEFHREDEMDEWLSGRSAEVARFRYNRNVLPITYVNCWSMGRTESVAMWKIYLNGDRGVAIRSTFNRLVTSFDGADTDIGISRVQYVDREYRFPKGRRVMPALLKKAPFAFERELRAYCFPFHQGSLPNFHLRPDGFHVQVDLPALVDRIVMAPCSDDSFIDWVKFIAQGRGISCDAVARSVMDDKPNPY